MLEKFAMRFSKAPSTAAALCRAACMNTAPAAVAGPVRSLCEKSGASRETAMRSCWHTYPPQTRGELSVEIHTSSEGQGK